MDKITIEKIISHKEYILKQLEIPNLTQLHKSNLEYQLYLINIIEQLYKELTPNTTMEIKFTPCCVCCGSPIYDFATVESIYCHDCRIKNWEY